MSQSRQPPPEDTSTEEQAPDFHGAAIIDEDGNEVPITEDMVKKACDKLEEESLHSDKHD